MPADQSEYTQEVRFAVVMYGGISLAIYINGIAQELLRMVRATAPAGKDGGVLKAKELSGSERVYRKLSYLLANDGGNAQEKLDTDVHPTARFVIDIISGTSAGGINGVFLAKALANGQNMDQLKQLWVREGAIEKLINDKFSADAPLSAQDPPASLLNGQRMYFELLKAFDGMGKGNGEPSANPNSENKALVKELDLIVTATDLRGITLPIRLTDDVIYERRHRNVFRFIYEEASDKNDFKAEHNPFLAYAARCTSAFPFAFEPMSLSDGDAVLERYAVYGASSESRSDSDAWKPFYRTYADAKGIKPVPFPKRAFGDGGSLDNKPFTFAIETLARRQADVPVSRKLVYIEPSPEHPEESMELDQKPNAIENVMYALLTLPRYETIREDLQRVIERNRLIQRINAVIEGVERDQQTVRSVKKKGGNLGVLTPTPMTNELWTHEALDDKQWGTLDLTDMIRMKGRAYLAYHRLGISAVTDGIAKLVARVAGLDEESDYSLVIRSLVRAWRVKTYKEYRETAADRTLNSFLHGFDISYPLRRLSFLQRKADQLHRLDDPEVLNIIRQREELANLPHLQLSPEEKKDFQDELRSIKRRLNASYDALRKRGRELRSRHAPTKTPEDTQAAATTEVVTAKVETPQVVATDATLKEKSAAEVLAPPSIAPITVSQTVASQPGSAKVAANQVDSSQTAACSPVYEKVQELFAAIRKRIAELQGTDESSQSDPMLQYFLGNRTDEHAPPIAGVSNANNGKSPANETAEQTAIRRAEKFLDQQEMMALFQGVADELENQITPFVEEHDRACLAELTAETSNAACKAARRCMLSYYQHYDDIDMIIYPILYDTQVGEAATVEVFRFSPEDATALIDERKTKCSKLAGTTLAHFGAFLEKRWRENDILWGRLDGAERIINCLLPCGHPQARKLIGEAQAAIVYETIMDMGEQEASELLSESLMRTASGTAEPALLSVLIDNLKKHSTIEELHTLIDDKKLRQYYLDTFDKRRQPNPESTLAAAARATTVIGKLLGSLSSQQDINPRYARWVARLGQIFWSLVEVSVPRSIPNLMFRHWLKLLYLFEVTLIVASTLLVSSEVQKFGLLTFGITVAVQFVVWILSDIISANRAWQYRLKYLLIGGAALLVVLGLLLASAMLGFEKAWSMINGVHAWYVGRPPNGLNRKLWARVAISLAFVLFLVWTIRDDIRLWWRRKFLKTAPPAFESIEILPTSADDKNRVRKRLLGARYIIPFRLSAVPPQGWVKMFRQKWKAMSQRKGRVTGHELSFVCTPAEMEAIFADVKATLAATNMGYQDQVKAARLAAEVKHQDAATRANEKRDAELAKRAAINDTLDRLNKQT